MSVCLKQKALGIGLRSIFRFDKLVVLQHISLVVAKLSFEAINVMLVIDHIQRIAHLLHQILHSHRSHNSYLVVRHHHDSSIELLQRLHQCLDRVHIQMVRRLVQQQNVRPAVRDRGEHHTRLLPSGQRPDRLHRQRPGNAERAQQCAQLLLLREGSELLHVLQRSEHVFQRVHVVLREVPDLQIVVAVDLAGLRLQRGVQHAEEGRFADSVGTEQRDATSHLHLEGNVLENRLGSAFVGERHVGELQNRTVVLHIRSNSNEYRNGLALRDRELDRRLLVLHHAARAALAVHPTAVVGVDTAQSDSLRVEKKENTVRGSDSSTSFHPAFSPVRFCSAWTHASESFRPDRPSSIHHTALIRSRSFAAAAANGRSDRGYPGVSRRALPAWRPSCDDDPPSPSRTSCNRPASI